MLWKVHYFLKELLFLSEGGYLIVKKKCNNDYKIRIEDCQYKMFIFSFAVLSKLEREDWLGFSQALSLHYHCWCYPFQNRLVGYQILLSGGCALTESRSHRWVKCIWATYLCYCQWKLFQSYMCPGFLRFSVSS